MHDLSGRSALFVIAVVSAVVLTSCATVNIATGRKDFILIPQSYEMSLGPGISDTIVSKYTLSNDPYSKKRLTGIGNSIVNSIPSRGIQYTFNVIEDDNLNAFTHAGGYIYATSGLMDQVKDDDELAAIIAHEIGHSEARHAVKQMEKSLAYNAIVNIGYMLDTRPEEEKKAWQYVKVGSDVAFKLMDLGYSRRYEYEADRLSYKYLEQAGYDPNALVRSFELLKSKRESKTPEWMYFLRSHPYLEDRMDKIKSLEGDRK